MARIDYYFSVLSPFTYLAGRKLEEIAGRYAIDIEYKPFDLMKVFKTQGTPALGERHESRRSYRLQELERISKHENMPINFHPAHWPTNPVPASCAIITAQMTGGGDIGGLVQGFLRATWAEEKDIAEDHIVRAQLEAHGFDSGLADKDMLSAVEIYEKNTNDALNSNVFGSPTYVLDHHLYWGQDRLGFLEKHLKEGGW
jgi:2-hydroxychromene-2-carboxylate isomerase